jgi:hypothetical protein
LESIDAAEAKFLPCSVSVPGLKRQGRNPAGALGVARALFGVLPMNTTLRFTTLALVCALVPSLGLAATSKHDKRETAAIKADCKAQAKEKHFGIHFIKRNKFVNECMRRRGV